jgi:FHS family L-fucose permease-like MFS transporter
MSTEKQSMFVLPDGRNVVVTFALVSSLFLLWGFCNGMIDVMDKHFQEELQLTLAQSAWVQFAHYLGYFLMAIPAGWLAIKLGYRGGIIAGLLMVAAGGLWFIPATKIAAFWAFLLGVCLIAAGLTFLETIANPYTTVLGERRYAATRINLAQSCNGIGWVFGPIAGSLFFYGKDASGRSTGAETLWIPYAGVAVVVLILAVIFYFAPVPDIKTEDDYHLDDAPAGASRSIWKHPHFVMAVVAQFFYVAAQAGIFSFFINYMTSQVPPIPPAMASGVLSRLFEVKSTLTADELPNLPALADRLNRKPDAVSSYLAGQLSTNTAARLAAYTPATPLPTALRIGLLQDLNRVVHPDNRRGQSPATLYDTNRFAGVTLAEKTRQLLAENPTDERRFALNRMLLRDALPELLPYREGVFHISDQGASTLASVGFICFLLGRFTGAGLLRRFSAHRMLGLYGLLNGAVCFLIFLKLGWFSVGCVFLSYFFMSIMFPTIFALGIFGLGARAKGAAAYIVMAIMGGAILPKFMGAVADEYDISRGFIVPLACFGIVALYGYLWPRLSKAESMTAVNLNAGH